VSDPETLKDQLRVTKKSIESNQQNKKKANLLNDKAKGLNSDLHQHLTPPEVPITQQHLSQIPEQSHNIHDTDTSRDSYEDLR